VRAVGAVHPGQLQEHRRNATLGFYRLAHGDSACGLKLAIFPAD
jgi:hypothetical protein